LHPFCFASTKLRLFAKIKHDPETHLLETTKKRPPFVQTIHNIQKSFGKYHLIFHPSAIEAEVLLFILFPLFNFDIWLIIIAIACLGIELIISGIGPVYLLLKK